MRQIKYSMKSQLEKLADEALGVKTSEEVSKVVHDYIIQKTTP